MSGTIAEQILGDRAESDDVNAGDHVICDIDKVLIHDLATVRLLERLEDFDVCDVWDPDRIVCVMDHIAPSHTLEDSNNKVKIRKFVREQGIEQFHDVGDGISHNVAVEHGYVGPGELVVGADSHTTSAGVVGAAATGLGWTDMAYVLTTGTNWFRVPETVSIKIDGELGEWVSSKDIALYLAMCFGTGFAQYMSIEFRGTTIANLSIDDRFTLTNLSVDLGAKFSFTPVDDVVADYIPNTETDTNLEPGGDANYAEEYVIDAEDVTPLVAKPHKLGNVVDVEDITGVELDQVFIGSCTNGKLTDLRAAASILEGNTVADGTRMIVTPVTRKTYLQAEREGLIRTFNEAGAIVTNATCGPCVGKGMGVLGDNEVCLAAQNRNFKGRMGSDLSEIYLSSPETAAASAIAGSIADPREIGR